MGRAADIMRYFELGGEISIATSSGGRTKIKSASTVLSIPDFLRLLNDPKSDVKKEELYQLLLDENVVASFGAIMKQRTEVTLPAILGMIERDFVEPDADLGEHKLYIKILSELSIKEFFELINAGIGFTLRGKHLFAIKYQPSYIVYWEPNGVPQAWKFPELIIGVRIDEVSEKKAPKETHSRFLFSDIFYFEPKDYIHPFKLNNARMCTGTFKGSVSDRQFRQLPFTDRLILLFRQAQQIIVSGWQPNVSPAMGHLTDSRYDRFKMKQCPNCKSCRYEKECKTRKGGLESLRAPLTEILESDG
ncbi:MAG: hypothetical protein ACFFCZ_26515 [Promethearchaeota archaeon]